MNNPNKKSGEEAIRSIVGVIQKKYGYDFNHYSKASLKRRLMHHQEKNNLNSLEDIVPYLLEDPANFYLLLSDLSVTVTDMFRDSYFYLDFSKTVIPRLKTYPYLKIWHAGCSTGEEVYSMAILLHENNYLDRVRLHATDFNPGAIEVAKRGIYPNKNYLKWSTNYINSGGKNTLDLYFVRKYEELKIRNFLQDKTSFSIHNLATDAVFCEVEVIVCRNVMIYFDEVLQHKTLSLFNEALVDFGFLCLGSKEVIDSPYFKCINREACIYQKVPK